MEIKRDIYPNQLIQHIKKQLEVDFVVTCGSEKYYIQSAFAMNNRSKQEQEERPLNAIGDSFRKIIVVRDNIKMRRNDMES